MSIYKLLSIIALQIFLGAPLAANHPGGCQSSDCSTVVLRHLGNESEAAEEENTFTAEARPWYEHHQNIENFEEHDPGDELEEDSSWAGQREEFSDKLLR